MAVDKKGDITQIAQAALDVDAQAIKVKITDTQIAMELSADDGDSVEARKPLVSSKTAVPSGTASQTVIVTADTRYSSEYLVAVNVTSAITATSLKIEIDLSPSDTDNVWHTESSLDCNVPNTGFFHVKSSTIGAWRRARARVVHSGYTAGEFDLYLNNR